MRLEKGGGKEVREVDRFRDFTKSQTPDNPVCTI